GEGRGLPAAARDAQGGWALVAHGPRVVPRVFLAGVLLEVLPRVRLLPVGVRAVQRADRRLRDEERGHGRGGVRAPDGGCDGRADAGVPAARADRGPLSPGADRDGGVRVAGGGRGAGVLLHQGADDVPHLDGGRVRG